MQQQFQMNNLASVWHQVEKMLADGISVIPVRDKVEIVGGVEFLPKTPYKAWKQFQTVRITQEQLWYEMEQRNTTAVAMVCGVISGNLEVVDIDVKWKPGVDALLFGAIRDFNPGLWARLRVHRSPSGGYHIPYRIASLPPTGMPGNLKLAKRPPSPEELLANPKDRAKCFIETRGDGGYVLAPPSMGYTIVHDKPIPTLTWEERESLINLCRLLDDMPKVAPQPTRTKADVNYYTTSPWDSFNLSPAAEEVLLAHGWKCLGRKGDYTHFTRPGKDQGISASFIHSKRMYFIFTTNGGLDGDRGYHPSTVMAELAHNGDKKAAYRWLVQNGYGVINPQIEARIAKKAAITGASLPSNISTNALHQYQEIVQQAAELYPYGVFWKEDEDDKIQISREKFTEIAAAHGFRYYRGDVVWVKPPFIYKSNDREFFDTMKAYIKEDEMEEYYRIADATEAFIQRSGSFTITRLPILTPAEILRDNATTAYKAYQDVIVKVTAQSIDRVPYSAATGLVWAERVQQRPFRSGTGGKYLEFLRLACEYDTHEQYIQSIIGYLAHDHKDETTGYIIVLTEQCPDPKDGGGSGKNMFGNLLKYTTTYVSKAGSQTKFDEKFFQVWNGQRIFAISDVPKQFDFSFLKEPATGSGVLKKLFKDEEVIAVEDMPKFMVQTNYSYEVTDGGLKRRIIPIEFTDFFTKAGGIDVHFGCHFPGGWDEQDWAGYDGLIITSLQTWFRNGRKIKAAQLTESGWRKQFEHTYGTVITEMFSSLFDYWCRKGFVSNDQFRKDMEAYYLEHGVGKNFHPSTSKVNKALADWCSHHQVGYKVDVCRREGLSVLKGKEFNTQMHVPF